MFNTIQWQTKIPATIFNIVNQFVADVDKFDEDHPYEEGLEWFQTRCEQMYKELDLVEFDPDALYEEFGADSLAECAAMALELC